MSKFLNKSLSTIIYVYKKSIKLLFGFFNQKTIYKIILRPNKEIIISKNLPDLLTKINMGENILKTNSITDLKLINFIFDNRRFLNYRIENFIPLYLLRNKRHGFFVEFGACDGIEFSNSLLLEREFEWKGVLVEPNKNFQKKIRENRSAIVDHRAVWSVSNQALAFLEVSAGGLSGLVNSLSKQKIKKRFKIGARQYLVETISLNDLLTEYRVPKDFDFLSIDTEGSELEILKELDFERFSPKIVIVEFNNNRKLKKLLISLFVDNGYKQEIFDESEQGNLWFVKL